MRQRARKECALRSEAETFFERRTCVGQSDHEPLTDTELGRHVVDGIGHGLEVFEVFVVDVKT